MYFKRPMCVLCLCFVFLFLIFARLFPPKEAAKRFSESIASKEVTVYGRLYKLEHKNYSTVLYLRDISLLSGNTGESALVQASGSGEEVLSCEGLLAYLADSKEEASLHIGCFLLLRGEYSPFDEAQNAGNFDAKQYYAIRRIYGRVKKARIQRVSEDYSKIGDMLFRVKERTKGVFFRYLGEAEAGTLTALILGDKTELEDEIKESYQNAGIAHILSLSGLHIAALGLLLLKMLRKSGLPVWAASLISGIVMLLYSIMTGLSTSTVRALVMYLLAVTAQSLGRTYDLISSAALAAILILLENPGYIYDSGFLLSFSAVMGISLLHPLLQELCKGITEGRLLYSLHNSDAPPAKFVKAIGSSLLFSLSIQFATLPVTQYCFFQLPVYGILLNLLVIPLMSALLGAGVLLSVTGNLAILFAEHNILHMLFQNFSILSSKITYAILKLYNLLTGTANGLPGNLWICGKPSALQILLYCFSFVVLLTLFSQIVSKSQEAERSDDPLLLRRVEGLRRRYRRISVPALFLSVVLLSFRSGAPLELHAISVGQGDCMLIYGKDTPVILIDGGATDVKNTGKYRIAPCLKAHGISKIDYVFISHFDADHVNGIIELLEAVDNGITIRRIIISAVVPLLEENPNFLALAAAAKENKRLDRNGVPVMLMDAGDIIEEGEISVACLGPDVSGSERFRGRDLNDNSLILWLLYKKNGFSALFTGDMSQATEQGILEDYYNGAAYLVPLSSPVTLLKAAHHGSKSASSPEFIKLVSPSITTISCGRDNSYGHPHKAALETLSGITGNRIYSTPQSGEITVKVYDGRITVNTWLDAK